MTQKFMAVDQYGHAYHGLTHPRKDLVERIGIKHVDKMYRDTPSGTQHVGYVIGRYWLSIYKVEPWKEEKENV